MPVIIPVASGQWGLGPSLFYLLGIVGAFAWLEWQLRGSDRVPTPEEESERAKGELFARLLIEAADERWGRNPKPK